jgi:hypothetical protein
MITVVPRADQHFTHACVDAADVPDGLHAAGVRCDRHRSGYINDNELIPVE